MVRDRRERGARQPVQEAHAVEQGDALREHVLVRPPAASDGGPRRRAPETDDAGDERQEERADEDDDEQDERHESEWAGLQELAGDDLEARFPDPEREGDGDERDRDREDPVEREAELRARPALPAAHLSAEAAADEAERALPQERHVEGVDEHVVAVELENWKTKSVAALKAIVPARVSGSAAARRAHAAATTIPASGPASDTTTRCRRDASVMSVESTYTHGNR